MCEDYYSLVKQFCEDYGFKVEYREGKYYVLEKYWNNQTEDWTWDWWRSPQVGFDKEIDAWTDTLNWCVDDRT